MHHLDNHGSTIIISHFEPYLLVMVLLDGCFFLLIYSYLLEILQPSTVWSLRISGISVISFFSNLLSFFLSLSISSYPPVSLNFSLSLCLSLSHSISLPSLSPFYLSPSSTLHLSFALPSSVRFSSSSRLSIKFFEVSSNHSHVHTSRTLFTYT